MKGATNAMTIGGTVGSDTKPIKIVDGQAVAVTNVLVDVVSNQTIDGNKKFVKPISLNDNGEISGSHYGSNPAIYQTWLTATSGNTTVQLLLQAQTDGHGALWMLRNNNWNDAIRLGGW